MALRHPYYLQVSARLVYFVVCNWLIFDYIFIRKTGLFLSLFFVFLNFSKALYF